jgi:ABC-2 type transport system ATP-binding protein
MYVRLGFAVAVNVDPDVLVVDEVLAVGDENFQRKCLGRIKEFQDDGRTILFVTHSPELVRQICDRAVVLDSGRVLGVGRAAEAIHLYHERLLALGAIAEVGGEPVPAADAAAGRRIRLGAVALEHPGSGTRPYLLPGEWLTVQVPFEAMEAVPDVVFAVTLRDARGDVIFQADTRGLGQRVDAQVGSSRIDFTFDRVPLLEGAFDIGVTVCDKRGIAIDVADQAARLEVMNPGQGTGLLAIDVRAEMRSSILG